LSDINDLTAGTRGVICSTFIIVSGLPLTMENLRLKGLYEGFYLFLFKKKKKKIFDLQSPTRSVEYITSELKKKNVEDTCSPADCNTVYELNR
jgi:hypothetical protein